MSAASLPRRPGLTRAARRDQNMTLERPDSSLKLRTSLTSRKRHNQQADMVQKMNAELRAASYGKPIKIPNGPLQVSVQSVQRMLRGG